MSFTIKANTQTLVGKKTLANLENGGYYWLEDGYKNLIGRFNSVEEMSLFCRENGYKLRLDIGE